jgi:signal transduction histidine kinase
VDVNFASGRLTRQPAQVFVRLAGIALLIWVTNSEVTHETPGKRITAWLLLAAVFLAWVFWVAAPRVAPALWLTAFCWLGVAGGALATLAPVAGLAVVGAAALGAGARFTLPTALAVSAAGPATLALAQLADRSARDQILAAAAASLAGLVVGSGRRDSAERARQQALVVVEHERAEVEKARADVLAERNRLAREVHDVLAHTLGSLSIQLEALDSMQMPDQLRSGIRRTKALAADGLADASQAVRALRDEALPLQDQVAKLCQMRGAQLSVAGEPRDLPADMALALYRVAQESLTNVAKHAPGATVGVRLGFEGNAASLAVENDAGVSPVGNLASSGAGYGLDGIRERVRLLGGDVAFGPHGSGWLVEVRLPT